LLTLLAGVAVAAAVAGSVGWGSASAATTTIEAGNNYFCSAQFDGSTCNTSVAEGDTVTWNVVGGTHTITECNDDYTQCPPDGGWDSGIVTRNATYSQTFNEPGVIEYRCELHPSEMIGRITVVEPLTQAPTLTPSPVASETASATATAAALPQTGGSPNDDEDIALYLIFGVILVAAGHVAFTFARSSRC